MLVVFMNPVKVYESAENQSGTKTILIFDCFYVVFKYQKLLINIYHTREILKNVLLLYELIRRNVNYGKMKIGFVTIDILDIYLYTCGLKFHCVY